MDVVSRRLELLKLEGLGLSQVEIVKQLSKNYDCAERTVYNDFETRTNWQPILQGVIKPEGLVLKTMNRHEQIYRQGSMLFRSSHNPLVQLKPKISQFCLKYLVTELLNNCCINLFFQYFSPFFNYCV